MKKSIAAPIGAAALVGTTEACAQPPAREPTSHGTSSATPAPAQPSTSNQKLFGDFAPKFVELTDDVLFGDIWERPGLSKRDRSLITVSALVSMNRADQLRFHLVRARENGVTQEELVEAITHLAFYSGWPSAYSAMTVAKEVLPPKK